MTISKLISNNAIRTMALAAVAASLSCSKSDSGTTATTVGASDASAPTKTITIRKAADPANLKLAFVTNNVSDFWKIASAGVHKYEAEAKVKVDIKEPSTGKTDEQNRIVENLTSQGYDGIAVSVVTPKDQVEMMNRAAEKTNVITFDSDCVKSNRILYIGTNNFEAGKVLGAQIVKLLPGGGKMAVFVGSLAADNAAQRLGGIVEAIKGHNIEIVAKKEDATDKAKARSNVEDVLNAYRRSEPGHRTVELQRPGHQRRARRPAARRAKCSRPRVRRRAGDARRHQARHDPVHLRAEAVPVRLPRRANGCTTWPSRAMPSSCRRRRADRHRRGHHRRRHGRRLREEADGAEGGWLKRLVEAVG